MAKAEQAYHKRNLYRDVTTRILAELDKGTVDRGSAVPTPFHIWRSYHEHERSGDDTCTLARKASG